MEIFAPTPIQPQEFTLKITFKKYQQWLRHILRNSFTVLHTCTQTALHYFTPSIQHSQTLTIYLSVPHRHTPVCRIITSLNMFLASPPESSPRFLLEQEPQECNSICGLSGGQRLCNGRAFRSPSPCGEDQLGERK